jgi:RNA polymerase sigma-70 factor, ECF subfamily
MPFGDDFPQVLDAARLGADWAWAAVYRDLAPSARGYLRARGAPDPDDVVGEAFLQVVRDLPRFEGGERELRAWVFTIVHHRLLDARRREARGVRVRRGRGPAWRGILTSLAPGGTP